MQYWGYNLGVLTDSTCMNICSSKKDLDPEVFSSYTINQYFIWQSLRLPCLGTSFTVSVRWTIIATWSFFACVIKESKMLHGALYSFNLSLKYFSRNSHFKSSSLIASIMWTPTPSSLFLNLLISSRKSFKKRKKIKMKK